VISDSQGTLTGTMTGQEGHATRFAVINGIQIVQVQKNTA